MYTFYNHATDIAAASVLPARESAHSKKRT